MTYTERKQYYYEMIETSLATRFKPVGISFDGLLEAMDYSLMAGGKRIRPMLVLELCRALGGEPETALDIACAVEMLHTYSLIHDDLPCMDNDDLRRGAPTCHKKFGECTAVLAGDALQAEAFGTILRSKLSAEIRAACAGQLAAAAGVDGICGGQFLDMLSSEDTPPDEELLNDIHSRKTASMIIAACRMGATVAGGSDESCELAMRYGAAIGAAFQIRDDMLDVLSTDEQLGKPAGSDERDGKPTFMSIYGAERCEQMIGRLTELACGLAAELGSGDFLGELARELAFRNK